MGRPWQDTRAGPFFIAAEERRAYLAERVPGTLQVWAEPFVALRVPKMFNLRTDPFERAEITSNTYYDWMLDRVCLIIPSQRIVGDFLRTFMQYPPRMKAATFTVDQVLAKMEAAMQSGH
jgi:arylsulfatase